MRETSEVVGNIPDGNSVLKPAAALSRRLQGVKWGPVFNTEVGSPTNLYVSSVALLNSVAVAIVVGCLLDTSGSIPSGP
jgi:hypothetical protein